MSLHWITDCAGPGRLAVAPRPRGGDWLDDDMRQWCREGVSLVVSALEPAEERELDLVNEKQSAVAAGLDFLTVPIPDRGTPGSFQEVDRVVTSVTDRMDGGKAVVVHCRAGLGRSALLAVWALVRRGVSVEDAMRRVSAARGHSVPETDGQREWLVRVAALSSRNQ
jgi:protein-tyrosine phosphatase